MILLGLACDPFDSHECIVGGAQTEGGIFFESLPKDGGGDWWLALWASRFTLWYHGVE